MGINGLSGINTMQAIISAGSAMTQVQRQGSIVANMKGREGVLGAEIKLDTARGGNVESKQEELAEVQKKLTQVQSAQMDILSDASKKLEEAVKADQKAEAEDKKTTKKKDEDVKSTDKVNKNDTVDSEEYDKKVSGREETVQTVIPESVNVSGQGAIAYPHVDVRL